MYMQRRRIHRRVSNSSGTREDPSEFKDRPCRVRGKSDGSALEIESIARARARVHACSSEISISGYSGKVATTIVIGNRSSIMATDRFLYKDPSVFYSSLGRLQLLHSFRRFATCARARARVREKEEQRTKKKKEKKRRSVARPHIMKLWNLSIA